MEDKEVEELSKEINTLRMEVYQLRELVRMLLEIVMDTDSDDDLSHAQLIPYMDGGRVIGDDYKDLGM
jgi:hypothetical protein